MNMSITIEDIEVHIKFPKKKSRNLLAQATVIFCGTIETHGWTVSKSEHQHSVFQESIWIQPPRVGHGIYWKKIVWTKDKALWKQIEEKIYDTYRLKKIDYGPKDTDEEDKEIEIDDLTI